MWRGGLVTTETSVAWGLWGVWVGGVCRFGVEQDTCGGGAAHRGGAEAEGRWRCARSGLPPLGEGRGCAGSVSVRVTAVVRRCRRRWSRTSGRAWARRTGARSVERCGAVSSTGSLGVMAVRARAPSSSSVCDRSAAVVSRGCLVFHLG